MVPELSPEEDYANDPATQFGVIEAQRHRGRGVNLSMFLGLMKYYRQSYVDLLTESGGFDYPKSVELLVSAVLRSYRAGLLRRVGPGQMPRRRSRS